ncbi:hypothetical protein E2C01_032910 [Portunus trituberculatus]|uniref:Uncharacterized protein n=1 Tax=Portunus trituberculatus TaxID=210409 RepID=A0A5B7F106_PORTR|nr:hypothetical protein [Portunus trituberculatus]
MVCGCGVVFGVRKCGVVGYDWICSMMWSRTGVFGDMAGYVMLYVVQESGIRKYYDVDVMFSAVVHK